MPLSHPVQYLSLGWGRLAWRRQEPAPGRSGPTVLLLHGLGGDQEDWQATVGHWPANWSWLAMDFRGHGRSSSPEAEFELRDLANDAWQLAQALTSGELFVVGYGLGGLVAQAMAQLSDVSAGGAGVRLRGLVVIESFATATAKSAFRRGRYSVRLPADRARRIQAKYATTRERFHPAFYDRLWASVIFFDTRPFLYSTPLPVHHIFGDQGRDAETDRKLMLPIRPNIQLHWVSGGGHYLLQEHPEPLARLIAGLVGG